MVGVVKLSTDSERAQPSLLSRPDSFTTRARGSKLISKVARLLHTVGLSCYTGRLPAQK